MLVSSLLGLLALCSTTVHAIGQASCVAFQNAASTFPVVSNRKATPILLSPDEWPGVQRAAQDFADDIQRVAGVRPVLSNVTLSATPTTVNSTSGGNGTSPDIRGPSASQAIIIGTLGKSDLIAQVVKNAKLDVSGVQGQWEAFMAKEVQNPLPGVKSAYVIIGADKRGSIFAMYDHSEQFGE